MKKPRQWKNWECWIINLIDIRLWFCDCNCEWVAPYGFVPEADCEKHDK